MVRAPHRRIFAIRDIGETDSPKAAARPGRLDAARKGITGSRP